MINDGLPPASCSTPNKSMFSNANKRESCSRIWCICNSKFAKMVTICDCWPSASRTWKVNREVIVVGKILFNGLDFFTMILGRYEWTSKSERFLSKICNNPWIMRILKINKRLRRLSYGQKIVLLFVTRINERLSITRTAKIEVFLSRKLGIVYIHNNFLSRFSYLPIVYNVQVYIL